MSRLPLQRKMNLGASDHLHVLHHAHNSSLALANSVPGLNEWRERVYTKTAAIVEAERMEANHVVDCYVVQNPIRFGKTRSFSNLSCLANCFVDLDTYKVPELAGVDPEEIYHRVIAAHPDMPKPTMLANSGRGMYLVWTFTKTKPTSFAPAWQQMENALVELLRPFGADPACRDASRLLRVSGTENSKALRAAGYQVMADTIRFEDLQRFTNRLRQPAQRNTAPKPKSNVTALQTGFASQTKNAFTLAFQRMQDIKTLAQLRGGKFTDLRRTAIFLYSLSAAWYCDTAASLEAEINSFIEDWIAEPERYNANIACSVVKRKQQAIDGARLTWNGREYDCRYRIRNQTMIRYLEITASEQRHMKAIIGKDEKAERHNTKRTERRRASGVIERSAYEKRAKDRQQQALDLSGKGLDKQTIARVMGISRASVINYLKSGG